MQGRWTRFRLGPARGVDSQGLKAWRQKIQEAGLEGSLWKKRQPLEALQVRKVEHVAAWRVAKHEVACDFQFFDARRKVQCVPPRFVLGQDHTLHIEALEEVGAHETLDANAFQSLEGLDELAHVPNRDRVRVIVDDNLIHFPVVHKEPRF